MNASEYARLQGLELRSSSLLVERAISLLARGPRGTAAIGAEILALRGNPRAAAAAVFTLLGSDSRFHVDASGVWSLVQAPPRAISPTLRLQEWVVVDVETTGGAPSQGHRVIEVAAVHVAGGKICGSYSSLVNPGRFVSRVITAITGITNEMVSDAPGFHEIAPRVADALAGKVFVGHNASFDWRFVSSELERCLGRAPVGKQLCTLRVARRMLPHLRSRSLGSLAEHYGFAMERHHRALDDAVATARLLLRFLDDLDERGVTDWPTLEGFFRARPQRRRRSARPRSMDAA